MLRANQINANVVTWTRLLSREAAGIVAGDTPTSSDRGWRPSQKKPPVLNISDGSPPRSTSHSGESSPKTPDTPSSWRESSGGSEDDKHVEDINGGSHPLPMPLPPPEPMSDADLVQVPDQIILPPPPQFVEQNDQQRHAAADHYAARNGSRNREQNNLLLPIHQGQSLLSAGDKQQGVFSNLYSPNGVSSRDLPPPLPPPPGSTPRRQSSPLPELVSSFIHSLLHSPLFCQFQGIPHINDHVRTPPELPPRPSHATPTSSTSQYHTVRSLYHCWFSN